MEFEWDTAKNEANQQKHGIGFREAAEIFRGFVLVTEDTRHDYGERRYVAVGEYDGGVIKLVFTRRESSVRIISAWKANRNDRKNYEKAREDREV